MKTIKILAVKKSYEFAPVFVEPYFDDARQAFLIGDKVYPAKYNDKAKEPYYEAVIDGVRVTDRDSAFEFRHGNEFDDSPVAQLRLSILRQSGYLAPNREGINPSSEHRFYLLDEDAEAKSKSTKADLVFEALEKVRRLTATDKRNLAFFAGQRARLMSEEACDGYVKSMAMEQPRQLMKWLENDEWKHVAFLNKLVEHGILSRTKGVFKHGEVVLGIDQDQAVSWIKNPMNSDYAAQLHAKLSAEMGAVAKALPEGAAIEEADMDLE
jgi:hypothetical protein